MQIINLHIEKAAEMYRVIHEQTFHRLFTKTGYAQ